MNQDTIEKFNAWLAEHFDPERTVKGRILRRKGVRMYPPKVHAELNKLLGGSYGAKTIRRARAGDDIPARLKRSIEVIVELEDLDAIRAYRRDQKLAHELSHAKNIQEIGGTAPDGGSIELWAQRERQRLNEVYETDAPLGGKARELWEELFEPKANQTRKERWAA